MVKREMEREFESDTHKGWIEVDTNRLIERERVIEIYQEQQRDRE